ncbi:isochorismatase domain-containing protein 1-like [Ischnura elegans]|uniref:isochorismatase domain-containing protein 1-like n=1 Tax=Ischnura elegans TaxID=197161 RepID=UPI001ED8AE43|nr:isochorismatase domain-containing protein 1-like [Ischnura elegans]
MSDEIANMADSSATAAVNNGAINGKNTAFFLCDVQEKFRPAMLYFKEIVEVSSKLVQASRILSVPLIVTEQNPDGLGKTVQELNIGHAHKVFSKTKFSMITPEVLKEMRFLCSGALECVVLFGLEAHVCIEQTAIELRSQGIQVHIVADATTSRSQEDRLLAFERMRQSGCFISTCESVLFKLLGDKNHPKFHEMRPFFKTTSPNTGLVSKI